jgi:NAD(P)-dependent dehydrogenase (short-subunit alcohol dehydrogenase family)
MGMDSAKGTIKDVGGIVTGVARHAARDCRDAARGTVDDMRRRASEELPALTSRAAIAAGVVTGASLALCAAGLVARSRARRHSFEGQTVLITGGSRGLGLVLARQFAAEGAHVAILARGGAALADAAQELRASGADIDAFEADISNRAEAERAVQRLISRWGRIDVLVNNAGQILSAPQQHVTVEDFERSMGVHFYGPLHLIRAAVPHMRRQGGGRIVNIASIGGKVAIPHLLPYCASKFALVGLSDGLRAELARDRIAVTTILPGLMRTGSHLNARFRGHHRREFAWFALADALPLTSMDVDRAAAKIIEATREKRARLIVSVQAKTLAWLDAMAPGLVASAMATANRVLPGAAGAKGNEDRAGHESRPRWMPSLVTRLADRAAERNNELRPRPPVASENGTAHVVNANAAKARGVV